MHTNFSALDMMIIIAYIAVLAGVGFYFSKKQSSLEMYFLAGRGMSWLPVGFSLMACLNSGIDYIMQPSAVIKYSIVVIIGVHNVTLPFFRRLSVYTAY